VMLQTMRTPSPWAIPHDCGCGVVGEQVFILCVRGDDHGTGFGRSAIVQAQIAICIPE